LRWRWYSHRVEREVTLARWGEIGRPVLVYPTAGGDAEEIERMGLVGAVAPLLAAGKIKIYSCDNVSGRALLNHEGSPEHRMWLLDQYHHYVRQEVVPAIRHDCRSDDIGVWTAGASIGAFQAAATLCRFPDVFHRALPMSGTFDLLRHLDGGAPTGAYRAASPLDFVPDLRGEHLDLLRTRYVHFACGEGAWEDLGESHRLAHVLGSKGIPNWVDSWGPSWNHDWPTWHAMLPKYLGDWTR
jgi:esterase/lipase superfamily enzyme